MLEPISLDVCEENTLKKTKMKNQPSLEQTSCLVSTRQNDFYKMRVRVGFIILEEKRFVCMLFIKGQVWGMSFTGSYLQDNKIPSKLNRNMYPEVSTGVVRVIPHSLLSSHFRPMTEKKQHVQQSSSSL